MTTAIILNAVLCLIALAVIVRLSLWGLRRPDAAEGGRRAERELPRDQQQDRLAA